MVTQRTNCFPQRWERLRQPAGHPPRRPPCGVMVAGGFALDDGDMPMRHLCLPMQASTASSRSPTPTAPETRMNRLLNCFCRKAPLPRPLPEPMPQAAATETAAAPAAPAAEAGTCGWFDSSLDLRQGLAVSEVRDPDWTVLLLWFGPAALRASVRLQ